MFLQLFCSFPSLCQRSGQPFHIIFSILTWIKVKPQPFVHQSNLLMTQLKLGIVLMLDSEFIIASNIHWPTMKVLKNAWQPIYAAKHFVQHSQVTSGFFHFTSCRQSVVNCCNFPLEVLVVCWAFPERGRCVLAWNLSLHNGSIRCMIPVKSFFSKDRVRKLVNPPK